MVKRGRKPSLSKLEEQQAELQQRIKELRKGQKREQADRESKRCAIIGQAIAEELADNPKLLDQLEPVIDRRVTKAKDRRFLGLEVLDQVEPAKSNGSSGAERKAEAGQ